jgi:hypothetical protein
MRVPLVLCLSAVVVEKTAVDLFNHSVIYYYLVYLSFIGFVSAFALGSLRSPLLSLPFALAATFLIPHEDCGLSVGVLPGLSIMPSWAVGSLCHGARRVFESRRSKISIRLTATDRHDIEKPPK